MTLITAKIGCWYQELQQGAIFEVVAIDEIDNTIETQLIDGAISEFDLDSWQELPLQVIEEPDDWRNAYELSQEDYLEKGDEFCQEEWTNPVDLIESDIINGTTDDMQDEN